jgi:hypothetical protein
MTGQRHCEARSDEAISRLMLRPNEIAALRSQ